MTEALPEQELRPEREARPEPEALPERIAALSRLVLNFRLLTLSVALIYIVWSGADEPVIVGLMLVASFASYLPLRLWDRLGPVLLRHPALLGADALFMLCLLAATGLDSPFFTLTLGTALLAGVLHGYFGAAFFSIVLVAGYAGVLALHAGLDEQMDPSSFQMLLGMPALYPLAALAAAAVRGLVDRQARTEAALAQAARAAAVAEERSRVARDMHDSVVKTLHGVSLEATALAVAGDSESSRTGPGARRLALAARRAAREARDLVGDLRRYRLEAPLAEAVRDWAAEWSQASGIGVETSLEDADLPTAAERWELLCILREALSNVEAHSGASRVTIAIALRDRELELEISDDGRGMPLNGDLRSAEPAGHFGLIGMAERAQRLGGRLELASDIGRGMRIVARVPRPDPPADAPAPARASG